VRTADNLTTFMCRLSRNLGASTSWNPKGLSRPVMGLLFFLECYCGFWQVKSQHQDVDKQRMMSAQIIKGLN
jgi:hypothetical protein